MSKKDAPAPFSIAALLRYHVVSLVRARLIAGEDRASAVAAVADMDHEAALGGLRRVSQRTVYRWLAAFEDGGAAALEDRAREITSVSRVLDEGLLGFLAAERSRDPDASIPELLRRARELGVLAAGQDADRTTVYRAMVRMKVPTGRTKKERARDMRRFAYEHRMEMVLADGKHFRAGAQRLRRVALFFLDDATRMGLHVVVGTSESADLFLRGLYEVLCDHGRMGVLYLDHGPGFVATAVAEVCRRLEIALVHGGRRYPQGHGKIERLNQTALAAVLRALDGRPDVDPACGSLELRLSHWLRQIYDHQPHEALRTPAMPDAAVSARTQSPWERWSRDPRALLHRPQEEIREAFVLWVERSVGRDRVVSLEGVAHELPRDLGPQGRAGSCVRIAHRVLEGTYHVLAEGGALVRIHPVDLAANARSPRARQDADPHEDPRGALRTAADMAFERDMGTVLDEDGGVKDRGDDHDVHERTA
jgi:transposase InsO family protein